MKNETNPPRIQTMKKKTLIWIAVLSLICLFLFLLFEFFTFGGFVIGDVEQWRPDTRTEQVTGDFKPQLNFGDKREYSTIIPMILRKVSLRPTNSISVSKINNAYGYNYERFEYVRFTKFEAHYESGYVQKFEKLRRDGSDIRGKKFEVLEGGGKSSLFWFKLDRIERCTVIIEGYSKLKISDKEEFFSYSVDWYIYKKMSIETRGEWFSSI